MSAEGSEQRMVARDAERLGRQFNSAVTNASAYGVDHPVAARALATLHEGLSQALSTLEAATLMLDRGSFFIEDHQIDRNFNSRRLGQLFRTAGLESVTFAAGVTGEEVGRFMAQLVDREEYPDVAALQAGLDAEGIESIRVNHVVLRKFTADDEVIARDGLEELTGLAEQAVAAGAEASENGSDASLDERIEEVFSLNALLQSPERISERLVETARETGDGEALAERVRVLGDGVSRARTDSGESVDPESIMNALAEMRGRLEQAVAGQDELARLMGEGGGVLDEVEELTCRTLVSIVREEMRAGEASPQRLAQIIRRVLPETEDLKRLLPMLKQGLLEEGMTLADYIAFVNELTGELQNDGLVQALEAGAEEIGLGVDEIVREIRRTPGDAARLVVLAAELRQAGGGDSDRLSEVLLETIERVSGGLAESDAASGAPLRQAVRNRQRELVAGMRAQGMPEELIERLEGSLDSRLDRSTGSLRRSRVAELLSRSESLEDDEVADQLARIVERETGLTSVGETLQRELASHGFEADRVEAIYHETLARLKRRNRVEFVPGSVMNPGATRYFLDREIATCNRYGTHFSCLMMMIAQVREGERDWRTISPDEIELLMPEVFDLLPPHLRDLDLLGTLGSKDRNIPLAILPMTDQAGADAVLERILDALAHAHLELSGTGVHANVLGTAAEYDPEHGSEAKEFIQWMKGRLASRLVTAMRSR